jgi:hypothetical protein
LREIRREGPRPTAGKWPVSDRVHPYALVPGTEKFSVRLPSLRVISVCHGVILEAAHGIPNPKSIVENWFLLGETVDRLWQPSSDFTGSITYVQKQSTRLEPPVATPGSSRPENRPIHPSLLEVNPHS